MRNKSALRLLIFCVCIGLLLSASGCSGKVGNSESGDTAPELSGFREQVLSLPDEMSYATTQCLVGDKIFTGGMGEAPSAGIVELNTGRTQSIELPEGVGYIYALCEAEGGAAMLCGDPPEVYYDAKGQPVENPDSEGKLSILLFDADGGLAGETELSGAYPEDFTMMVKYGQDYILLSSEMLVEIDGDGNETNRIERGSGQPFSSMCLSGKELIVSRRDLGKPKSEICMLDAGSFKLRTLAGLEGMITGLGLWTDGRLLISDRLSLSVRLLEPGTGETSEAFFLYELGLESESVQSMTVWGEGLVFFCHGQECITLALPDTQEDGPTELILATDSPFSPLTLLVSWFNSENKDYKITIKDYSNSNPTGITGKDLLATELIAGKAPDIFAFFESNFFPEDSGYFEDLLPWLDADAEYGRQSIVPGLFEALTADGSLHTIPYEFNMITYIANPEALGGKMSFSVRELAELRQSLDPSQNLFDYFGGVNLRHMLSGIMLNSFIDEEAGTCSFDSPEFVQMLEFIKDVTPPFPPDENTSGLDDGNFLIKFWPVQSIYSLRGMKNELGGDYGFVEITRGEVNCFEFDPVWSFYMSSQSQHKEGVWEFIRSTFRQDVPRDRDVAFFPASQAVFQAQIDAALAGELLDWVGEKVTLELSDVDKLTELFNKTKYMNDGNNPALGIIYEECQAYFAGARSAEDTAKIIQSRVGIYAAERS